MSDSQKFISRNRAPRVQIEYDVELYGAEKQVQLPFVMGVMADLSGKAEVPAVADRQFLAIDVDNFDDRMKAMAPRAQFSVPNTLTGEGSLAVDLTFEKMSDFSPEAIAEKVGALAPLLEARRQLSDLMAYMDGKAGAETLIETLLASPALMQALGSPAAAGPDAEAALAGLRARLPDTVPAEDTTGATLSALRDAAPDEVEAHDEAGAVLSGIARVEETAPEDTTGATLSDLSARAPAAEETGPDVADILSGVEPSAPEVPEDSSDKALSALRDAAPDEVETHDEAGDVLSGIARVEETAPEDTAGATLSDLSARAPEPEEAGPDVTGILSSIDPSAPETPDDSAAEALSALRDTAPDDVEAHDEAGDVLSGIARVEDTVSDDTTGATLSDLTSRAPEPEEAGPDVTDILSSIDPSAPEIPDDSADEALSALRAAAPGETEASDEASDVLSGVARVEVTTPEDTTGATLSDLSTRAPGREEAGPDVAAILSGIDSVSPDLPDSGVDEALGGLHGAAESAADPLADLDDLLDDLGDTPTADDLAAAEAQGEPGSGDDLDTLLTDLGREAEEEPHDPTPAEASSESEPEDDLDSLLADLGGDEVEAPQDPVPAEVTSEPEPEDDLDALLADLGGDTDEAPQDPAPAEAASETEPEDDLNALLADLGGDADDSPQDPPPASVTAAAPEDDLDALMADLGATMEEAAPATAAAPAQSPFGTISVPRPEREALNRRRFRIAVLGDFTGRAGQGLCAIGDDLAARRAIPLDVDTIDEVIEGFATKLTLPIGKDGAGIAVKLGELDDLHPDELYDNVEIFDALSGLRQQLATGSMAAKAAERLTAWGEAHGTPVRLPKRSASTSIPADMRLSDFQRLIGDTAPRAATQDPAEEIIARIVGPHIVKAPDAGVGAMQAAVDEALSSAMRLVLHHPDFQAVEALWRSLDMLARRIETDSELEIVLYDISAAEIAADLAAQEDLSKSGLFRLLTDVLDPDTGDGGFSALFGLYTFEETPPHAELLARLAQVAAHVDAPVFTAITPAYLDTAKEDRHPLVAEAWDALRAMPEANYVGLVSPRFLLRLPYGKRSDPCSAFDFEEFTPREGLSGMLWGNPVVLVAVLLAAAHKKDGRAMQPGSLMSLGDMPFHFVTDRHGDQVALPCTERNLTSDPVQQSLARGIMPVVSIKGRNEVRLASFRSLGGDTIAGPWSGDPPPARTPPPPDGDLRVDIPAAPAPADTSAQDAALDEILAGFDDDDDAATPTAEDEMDPELAALLEDL